MIPKSHNTKYNIDVSVTNRSKKLITTRHGLIVQRSTSQSPHGADARSTQTMTAKPRRVLHVVSGWDAVEVVLKCWFIGLWQLAKIAFARLWKGHRRKCSSPPVELQVDASVGTHYYIKVMGVKYHYVETGPKKGRVVLALGDAPEPTLFTTAVWSNIVQHLTETDHRVVTLDLRGSGGSETGSRGDLSPPRVVEELRLLLKALGVSECNQAVVIGHGIGGMLAWYLAHSSGSLIDKFAVIDAPHPSLYWQYPPADFCNGTLHFIQWPFLPERWLAEGKSEGGRWSSSRASDWTGALNYVRGAAWWRIRGDGRAKPPALLVARGKAAAQLVASAERCLSPTLRMIPQDSDLLPVIIDFLIASNKDSLSEEAVWRGGLVGRMLGAVAGRGRELSARLLLPPTTA